MGGGHGGRVHEKPKEFKATLLRLVKYCRSYLPAIIVAMVVAIAATILSVIGPNKIRDLTNEIGKGLMQVIDGVPVLGAIDLDAIGRIAWFLVACYGGALLLGVIQSQVLATVTQRISKQMRTDISTKINRLPLSYFDKTTKGDILSRVTNDVDTIGQTLNQSISTLVTAVTMIGGSLVMMLINSVPLTLVAVGCSLVGFIAMMLIMSKSQRYFVRQQNTLGEVNGHIEEIYAGQTIVKSYNATGIERRNFDGLNTKLYQSAWRAQFLSGLMMPLMTFIGNFGYVAVCVVGAILTMHGHISFGVIVAFMLYIRLFTQPLSQLAQAFQNLQSTAAAGERVFAFLGEPELSDESHKTQRLDVATGDVEFRGVKFSYEPGKEVIHDFSAHVYPGQQVAIVGPTGAGKTTLVNLLMRFYELDDGAILLDGIPISELTREDVHRQFGMVLQDTWLFEDTIRANIVYQKEGVSDEDVIAVCKSVGLHHFISTLPNGYDTVLDNTVSLSEGQKQLITVARAMVQNAPLLILDEATSSVDTRTERLVQAAMEKLTEGRTSFVIAHRLSTIRDSDVILVVRDGDIVESGTHEELMDLGGFYAELYNSQFEMAA